jgi:N-methylhydantoinase A
LTWTLVLSSRPTPDTAAAMPDTSAGPAPIDGNKQVFDAEFGKFVTASVIRRDALQPGSTFDGPAIIIEDQTTTYVPGGFKGTVSSHGHLVLKRHG